MHSIYTGCLKENIHILKLITLKLIYTNGLRNRNFVRLSLLQATSKILQVESMETGIC